MNKTLYYNINTKFGQIDQLKKSCRYGLSSFYCDVLKLLYNTGTTYGLTINQTIALYNSYSDNFNYIEIDKPFSYRFKGIPDEIINYINDSTVRKKLTHSEIFKLILNQSEDANIALAHLIKIKIKIDNEFGKISETTEKKETVKKEEKQKTTTAKKQSSKSNEVVSTTNTDKSVKKKPQKKDVEEKQEKQTSTKKTAKSVNLSDVEIHSSNLKNKINEIKQKDKKIEKQLKKIKANANLNDFF